MNEFGTANYVLLNDNYDRIGGIVMKTFGELIDFVKKVFGEKIRTDVPYNFYEERRKFLLKAESSFYAEKLIIK